MWQLTWSCLRDVSKAVGQKQKKEPRFGFKVVTNQLQSPFRTEQFTVHRIPHGSQSVNESQCQLCAIRTPWIAQCESLAGSAMLASRCCKSECHVLNGLQCCLVRHCCIVIQLWQQVHGLPGVAIVAASYAEPRVVKKHCHANVLEVCHYPASGSVTMSQGVVAVLMPCVQSDTSTVIYGPASFLLSLQ